MNAAYILLALSLAVHDKYGAPIGWQPYHTAFPMFVTSPEVDRLSITLADAEIVMTIQGHGSKLTVYRDGHIVTSDPSKLDEQAKLFWELLAKYSSACKGNE